MLAAACSGEAKDSEAPGANARPPVLIGAGERAYREERHNRGRADRVGGASSGA